MAYIVKSGSVGDEIGKVLCQQIGILPKNVCRIVLDFRAGEAAIATIEYYLDGPIVSELVIERLKAIEWEKVEGVAGT